MKNNIIIKIANICFKVDNLTLLDSNWGKYKCRDQNCTFSIKVNDRFEVYYRVNYLNLEKNDKYLMLDFGSALIIEKNWTNAILFTINKNVERLILMMFCVHSTKQKCIILHSSFIKSKNKGILFLGPSGIGKTTQAELWNRYREALIINGDIALVQETEENFLGWGTPWHGSSPYCENTSVPVHAMIVLKQASENSIRELTGFEKVTAVSNNVFYPQWLENGMELCLETLDHLLSAIPVYELSCRPDEEAVRLTEETLFGN